MIRNAFLQIALLNLLIMTASIPAFAIESPVPSPRPSQDMVGFHKWFQERLILSRDQWALYHSGTVGKYKYDFDIENITVENFNDYMALNYYLIETNSHRGSEDYKFVTNELKHHSEYNLDNGLVFLERARQGICDKYSFLYGVSGVKGYNRFALKRWQAVAICMDVLGQASGKTEPWMKEFAGRATNSFKIELMRSKYFSSEVTRNIGLYFMQSLKCRVSHTCTLDEYVHTFKNMWEKWGKEAVENFDHPRKLNFKRGKELYDQYGQNFPQPSWVQAMREINEKTPEEWEKEVRAEMGEAGDDLFTKVQRNTKRYFEEERKKKQKQAVPVTKSASKPSPKPDTVSDTDPDSNTYLPWILGILALLSALMVSVIIIRRRGR